MLLPSKICPECREEYVHAASVCVHCDAPLVLEFLEYLQRVRGNAPRTRNARLTAIKSFMHFVEYRVPSALEQVNRVLAIPNQKTDIRLVDHLTAEQCQAILDNPAPPHDSASVIVPCST